MHTHSHIQRYPHIHTHPYVYAQHTKPFYLVFIYFFFGFIIWNLVLLTFVIDKSPYMHPIICTYTLTHMHQHTQSNFKFQNKVVLSTSFNYRSNTIQSWFSFKSNQLLHKRTQSICMRVHMRVCVSVYYRQAVL